MSFLEWVGLASIMIWIFIGLIYVLKSADSKKNNIENSYIEEWNTLVNDDDNIIRLTKGEKK
jgi:hypothetical protein